VGFYELREAASHEEALEAQAALVGFYELREAASHEEALEAQAALVRFYELRAGRLALEHDALVARLFGLGARAADFLA